MLVNSYYLEVVRKIFIEDLTFEHALTLLKLSRDIFEVVFNNLFILFRKDDVFVVS